MVGLRRRHLVNQLNPAANFDIDVTQTLNAETHANRRLNLTGDGTTLQTYTMPEAIGSGNKYKFFVRTTNTGTYVINTEGAGTYIGNLQGGDSSDEDTSPGWLAQDGDNFSVFTCGDVTRGEIGSWFEMTDVAADIWFVHGIVVQSGNSEVTPFT